MPAARKVGGVAIEAVADTTGFERDLEKSLKEAVNEASKEAHWDPLVGSAGKAGDRSGRMFGLRFGSRARNDFEDGSVFGDRTRIGSFFGRAGASAAGFFSQGFSTASDVLTQLGKSGGLLSGLFSSLSGIGSGGFLANIGSLLISLGLLTIAVPLLTGALFALGGVVTGLVGTLAALPALFAGILVTILPLVIAFQGFGEAMSALTSGDLEKFDEALKNLAPSAAGFARELQRLMPFFSGLRRLVQEAFFAEILGSLENFVRRAGPAISGGLGMIATALGELISGLINLFSQRNVVDFMAQLFLAVSDGLSRATPIMLRFFDALLSLASAALPVVDTFFASIGSALDEFSAFLLNATQTGEFQAFLRDSFEILAGIGGILRELAVLAGVMFGDESTRTGAKEFLGDIERLLADITAWFRSEDGQLFLQELAVLAEDFFDVLNTLVFPILRLILQTIVETINAFRTLATLASKAGGNLHPGAAIAGLLFGTAAEGGITQGPVIAGEAGTEAILPLDDPIRARQIASDPLVQNVLGGGGDTTVWAIFDGEPFQARIVRTAQAVQQTTARQLTQKPRTVLA